MSKYIDFVDLWKKGGDGAPQASIIGGLQKLLNQKEKELVEVKSENHSLREQITENITLLEEAEKVIASQTNEIEDLRAGFIEVEEGGKKVLKPSITPQVIKDTGEKYDEQTTRKFAVYEQQIRALEEKLYIYSTLPDRIATLEQQKDELNVKIDQYSDREESLRNTIKKLTSGMDDKATMNAIVKENDELKKEINELRTKAGAPGGGRGQDSVLVIDTLQSSIKKLEAEKSFLNQQINEVMAQKSLIEQRLHETQNQFQTYQLASKDGLNQQQILEYQAQISGLQQEINKLTAASTFDPAQLQRENAQLKAENAQIKRELAEKSKVTPINDMVQDLQMQISRLKAQNKALQDEVNSLKQ